MSAELKKEYTNGEVAIVRKSVTCIHSGECVKNLPKVYKPKKTWIKMENATTEELKNQIDKCPSWALSYYENK
jgi:uncharacterized Fe-S cluster protein YjdI